MRIPALDDWSAILTVAAAHETGLLAELEAGGTVEALGRRTGTDARAARIVLERLIDLGLADRDGSGRLTSSRLGRRLARPAPHDGDPLAGVLLAARDIAAQIHLPAILRGDPPPHDMSAGDPASRHRFLRAMRDVAAPRAAVTVAALPPRGAGRLLDVGGAPGSYALPFRRAGWGVTVVDLEETLRLTRGELEAAGITCVAADIAAGLPEGPWDCVYLGNVVHLFGPDAAAALVRRAGAAVAPGGRLAVQEVIRGLAAPAAAFGVTMLAGTAEGDAYDLDTLGAWMTAAGCPPRALVAVEPGRHHLVIGDRPGDPA